MPCHLCSQCPVQHATLSCYLAPFDPAFASICEDMAGKWIQNLLVTLVSKCKEEFSDREISRAKMEGKMTNDSPTEAWRKRIRNACTFAHQVKSGLRASVGGSQTRRAGETRERMLFWWHRSVGYSLNQSYFAIKTFVLADIRKWFTVGGRWFFPFIPWHSCYLIAVKGVFTPQWTHLICMISA